MSASETPKRVLHVQQPKRIRVEALIEPDPEVRADPNYEPIPCLKLRGMWLRAAGVKVGCRMAVDLAHGCITLTVIEPPVVEHKRSIPIQPAA